EKGRTGGNSPLSPPPPPPPSFSGFGMPGKGKRTPATKATGEVAAATQPSILSFFGRGNGGAPKPAAKQLKAKIIQEGAKSIAAQQASSLQVEDGRAAPATPTTTRAGKRGEKAKADEQPEMGGAAIAAVDLTTATTETATTTPAAAASAAVGEKPRKSSLDTASNVRRGKQDRSGADSSCAAAAAAAVASTPNAKAVSGKHRPLSPAGGGVGRGGAADARSPETDSETSPAAMVVSKRGHEESGSGQRGGRPRPTKRGRAASPSSLPIGREGVRQEAGHGDGDLGRGGDRAVMAGGLKAAAEEERRRPAGELSDEDSGGVGVGGGGKGSDEAGDKTDGEEEGGPQRCSGGGRRNENGSKQGNEVESTGGSKEKEEKEGAGAGHGANEEGEEDKDEDVNEEEKDDAEQDNADDEEDQANAEAGGISQYELQRLERIKRNQAFMATLGLATAKPTAASSTGSSSSRSAGGSAKRPNKKRSRPVSRASERAPAVPVRRSARARGAEAVDYSEDKQAINAIATAARAAAAEPPKPDPVLEEVDFDDSTVFKYLCEGRGQGDAGDAERSSSAGVTGPLPGGSRVVGVRVVEPGRAPLSASGLSTIYTMHFCGAGATASGAGG
ncbi:unnamed protein product, partial [Scytosiphon promiscuus]